MNDITENYFNEFESVLNQFDLPSQIIKQHPQIEWNAQQIGWLIRTGHVRGMKNQHFSVAHVQDVLEEWQRVVSKKQVG